MLNEAIASGASEREQALINVVQQVVLKDVGRMVEEGVQMVLARVIESLKIFFWMTAVYRANPLDEIPEHFLKSRSAITVLASLIAESDRYLKPGGNSWLKLVQLRRSTLPKSVFLQAVAVYSQALFLQHCPDGCKGMPRGADAAKLVASYP